MAVPVEQETQKKFQYRAISEIVSIRTSSTSRDLIDTNSQCSH